MKAQKRKDNLPEKSAATASVSKLTYWLLTVILLLTLVIYLPSLQNGFTEWDDQDYVTENKIIPYPENVWQMFTTPVSGNYHPVTMYSLAMDYKIAQKLPAEEKAFVYHATNLVFHLLNVLLVFFFLQMLSAGRIYMALFSALLFAIHPMHVESVAWIPERKDVLYSFFFFLSLIAYLRYSDSKQLKWLLLCFVGFLFSLGAKPAAVVLPVVLLAIDFFKKRKITTATVIEKVPFLMASLFIGYITFELQAKIGAVSDRLDDPFLHKILFAAYGTMMYFIKLLFPFHLSNLYPYPNVAGESLGWLFYVAPLVDASIIAGLIYFSSKHKVVLFGLAFFFINVVLVLQFFTVGQALYSDRYTYVSYLGLFMIMSWWLDSADSELPASVVKAKPVLHFGFLILACGFMVQTASRIKVWQNAETLWTDAINKFPKRLPVAHIGLGYFYKGLKEYDKAIAEYNNAIALSKDYGLAYQNRGIVFFDVGKYDQAIADYDVALKIKPDLWKTFSDRGAAKVAKGDYKGGLEDLNISIAHDSSNLSALMNRALTYTFINDHPSVVADCKKILALTPDDYRVYNAMGVSYRQLKQYNESIAAFNKAIELLPSEGLHYLNRSKTWYELGNIQSARADMNTALRLGTKSDDEYANKLNAQ